MATVPAATEYKNILNAIAEAYNVPVKNIETVMAAYNQQGSLQAAIEMYERATGQSYIPTADGSVSIIKNQNGQAMYVSGSTNVSYSASSVVDSNTKVIKRTKFPINNPVGSTAGSVSWKAGVREAGNFVLGEVAPAVMAAGVGISLGRTIDAILYNANPDYWDEHGMSSLNPDTWGSITSGDSSIGASLFNLVFGIDGDNTQPYIDDDAYAYLAYYLASKGFFATESMTGTPPEGLPVNQSVLPCKIGGKIQGSSRSYDFGSNAMAFANTGNYSFEVIAFNNVNEPIAYLGPYGIGYWTPTEEYTFNEKTVYVYRAHVSTSIGSYQSVTVNPRSKYTPMDQQVTQQLALAWLACYGAVGPTEGIGDQTGATQPDTSTWSDPAATKSSLQQQYPDTWANAKHYDYVDDDGTQKTKTLIPVNLPNTSNPKDTKPTSGNESQSKTDVDPETSTDQLIDLITDVITGIVDANPTDTGSGNSPTVVTPSGSASSLWAVYNPTQAQVDAFGSWLWSSNLVDQIKKLFNNPMEAIIGIHKVYATPSTGSSVTIKCGYIDSEVPALAVTDQYTTVDCGTVNISEYFGNIFDYAPYTKVDLFLPFIGIVSLDVADVMRSSVSVKYSVDVITGACLAEVKVSRDGFNPVMYSYSGSCAVSYPLSSGSYASALAGVASIAAGVVGTIASGGALAPALIGGAVGATALHSDVQKSGGFSGCAGAMGAKKPYLIISRPQTAMPGDVGAYKGYPASKTVTLSACSGFVQVDSCHLEGITATDQELQMIEQQLKQGVII